MFVRYVYISMVVQNNQNVMCFCRCACVSGFMKRFCGTLQWTVFAAATAAMFTVSLVGAVMIDLHVINQMCHAVESHK